MQLANRETEILRELAADYVARGYEFILEPELRQIPDFLKPYRPDALALGTRDSVVIEIKSTQIPKSPHLRALAEEIERHDDWHLRVVLVEPGRLAEAPEPKRPSIAEIKPQLNSARRLFKSGERAASLLLLWSLLEAVSEIRLAELDETRRPQHRSPEALSKDLISFGLSEQDDHERMRRLAWIRNVVAHGFTATPIGVEDFQFLARLVQRLADGLADMEGAAE